MERATPRPQNVTARRREPARTAAAPRSEILMTGRGPCAQIRVAGVGFGTRGHADDSLSHEGIAIPPEGILIT
jgi:hypothetical protein